MRHPAPTPTESALPLPRDRLAARASTAPVHPDPLAIERYNALVHELYRDAPQIDASAIAAVSTWLQSQPPEQRESLLRARLDHLGELEAMRLDADWPLDPAQAHRIDLILEYVAAEDDLIPDSTPTYGFLDDALLLELAWPVLADDVDDYRDFCEFRAEHAHGSDRPLHQLDWMRARAEEGALWEHMHRVHDLPYLEHRPWSRIFSVS
jgi:hypothetical protein